MEVFYDPKLNSLVYYGEKSSPEHWDNHWLSLGKMRHNAFVLKYTFRHLAPGAKILEAGCGNGEKVLTLHRAGYTAYGLDWAKNTIDRIQKNYPEILCVQGDIRALPFDDNTFDGYWSLGVIEHFSEGFEAPLYEAARVLKIGGFAFVTVPSMSWIRKIKARNHLYPANPIAERDDFFQYVYDPNIIIKGFLQHGFELISCESMDGVKGLKDEIGIFRMPLAWIYNGKNLFIKVIRRVLQIFLSPFAGHIRLYIFRKVK